MIKLMIPLIFSYSSTFVKNNVRPFLIDVVPPSDQNDDFKRFFTSSTTDTLLPLLDIVDDIHIKTTTENYIFHRLWKVILEDEEVKSVSQLQTPTQQNDIQTQTKSLPSCSDIQELLKNYKYGDNSKKIELYSLIDKLIFETITNKTVFNKTTNNVTVYTSIGKFQDSYESIITQQLEGQKKSIPHVISVYSIIPIDCTEDNKTTTINIIVIISIPQLLTQNSSNKSSIIGTPIVYIGTIKKTSELEDTLEFKTHGNLINTIIGRNKYTKPMSFINLLNILKDLQNTMKINLKQFNDEIDYGLPTIRGKQLIDLFNYFHGKSVGIMVTSVSRLVDNNERLNIKHSLVNTPVVEYVTDEVENYREITTVPSIFIWNGDVLNSTDISEIVNKYVEDKNILQKIKTQTKQLLTVSKNMNFPENKMTVIGLKLPRSLRTMGEIIQKTLDIVVGVTPLNIQPIYTQYVKLLKIDENDLLSSSETGKNLLVMSIKNYPDVNIQFLLSPKVLTSFVKQLSEQGLTEKQLDVVELVRNITLPSQFKKPILPDINNNNPLKLTLTDENGKEFKTEVVTFGDVFELQLEITIKQVNGVVVWLNSSIHTHGRLDSFVIQYHNKLSDSEVKDIVKLIVTLTSQYFIRVTTFDVLKEIMSTVITLWNTLSSRDNAIGKILGVFKYAWDDLQIFRDVTKALTQTGKLVTNVVTTTTMYKKSSGVTKQQTEEQPNKENEPEPELNT